MNAFDQLRDDFAALKARVTAEATTLRLGTYQADGSVLLPDGAALTPAAVLAYVETGDTVLVGHHLRRAWVLGKVSPDGPPDPYEPPDPVLRFRAGQATISVSSTVATASVSFGVTFPSTPRVFVQITNDSDSGTQATAESASTTGFTLRVRKAAAYSETFYVNWLAVPDGSTTI